MFCLISMSLNQVPSAWEQRAISEEKGSRIVHYVLRGSNGNSLLAVSGIGRSRNLVFHKLFPRMTLNIFESHSSRPHRPP